MTIPWARCDKCGQKLVAEVDSGDGYCLNCETCSRCGDVHHMEDRCQEATEAQAQLADLREAHRNESDGLDNWRRRAERAEAAIPLERQRIRGIVSTIMRGQVERFPMATIELRSAAEVLALALAEPVS